MILKSDLENWFTYHRPTVTQAAKYEVIRQAAFDFAIVVLDHCPASPDTTAAIRKIREAVMTANAAIACGTAEKGRRGPAMDNSPGNPTPVSPVAKVIGSPIRLGEAGQAEGKATP